MNYSFTMHSFIFSKAIFFLLPPSNWEPTLYAVARECEENRFHKMILNRFCIQFYFNTLKFVSQKRHLCHFVFYNVPQTSGQSCYKSLEYLVGRSICTPNFRQIQTNVYHRGEIAITQGPENRDLTIGYFANISSLILSLFL